MRFAIFVIGAALVGCAQQGPNIAAMTPAQADCYGRARGSGSGIGGPSIVWQMAIQNEVERDVYLSCMRAKGLTPHGRPIAAAAPGETFLGMTFRRHPGGGVEVTAIDPRSEAAARGIGQNDVILALGAYEVVSPEQLRGIVETFRRDGHKRAGFKVRKVGGTMAYVAIRI